MQGGQDCEFFTVQATEINVFIQAMYGQENRVGLELRHRGDAFAFVAFAESIARDIEIVGILANLKQQIVHWIAQSEQADIGLQSQAQLRGDSRPRDPRA